MTDLKQQEASFRASLEDVIVFLERVGSVCGSLEECLVVARLGLLNDGQLRLIMSQMRQGKT